MNKFDKILKESVAQEIQDIRDREGIKFDSSGGHPTQRSNTVATHRKFYEMIKRRLDNPEEAIGLDYSSGLGVGSSTLRSEFGANIESYEPYPSNNAVDITYAGLNSLPDKEYDYIINSAVLNVVEQDIRDSIVLDIWNHLKAGGVAVIGVRSFADVMGTKTALIVNAEKGEIIDRQRGSYQKGFKIQELKDYISGLLPEAIVQRVDMPVSQVAVFVYKDKI